MAVGDGKEWRFAATSDVLKLRFVVGVVKLRCLARVLIVRRSELFEPGNSRRYARLLDEDEPQQACVHTTSATVRRTRDTRPTGPEPCSQAYAFTKGLRAVVRPEHRGERAEPVSAAK